MRMGFQEWPVAGSQCRIDTARIGKGGHSLIQRGQTCILAFIAVAAAVLQGSPGWKHWSLCSRPGACSRVCTYGDLHACSLSLPDSSTHVPFYVECHGFDKTGQFCNLGIVVPDLIKHWTSRVVGTIMGTTTLWQLL